MSETVKNQLLYRASLLHVLGTMSETALERLHYADREATRNSIRTWKDYRDGTRPTKTHRQKLHGSLPRLPTEHANVVPRPPPEARHDDPPPRAPPSDSRSNQPENNMDLENDAELNPAEDMDLGADNLPPDVGHVNLAHQLSPSAHSSHSDISYGTPPPFPSPPLPSESTPRSSSTDHPPHTSPSHVPMPPNDFEGFEGFEELSPPRKHKPVPFEELSPPRKRKPVPDLYCITPEGKRKRRRYTRKGRVISGDYGIDDN